MAPPHGRMWEMVSLDAVYMHLWAAHGDEFDVLDRSLGPRSWTFLFDVAAAAVSAGIRKWPMSAVAAATTALSLHGGLIAGTWNRSCSAATSGCTLDRGARSASGICSGRIEQLPIRTQHRFRVVPRHAGSRFAISNCAFGKCCRTLRGGGKMLAWVTVETELMEPGRQSGCMPSWNRARKCIPAATRGVVFERGICRLKAEKVGSELIEFYEERDGRASRELMRIARMRRMREQLIGEWGKLRYDTATLFTTGWSITCLENSVRAFISWRSRSRFTRPCSLVRQGAILKYSLDNCDGLNDTEAVTSLMAWKGNYERAICGSQHVRHRAQLSEAGGTRVRGFRRRGQEAPVVCRVANPRGRGVCDGFSSGGVERHRYRFKEGSPFPGVALTNEGSYQDIVPGQRIVETSTMSLGDRRISTSLVTIEFLTTDQGPISSAHTRGVLRGLGWSSNARSRMALTAGKAGKGPDEASRRTGCPSGKLTSIACSTLSAILLGGRSWTS